MAQIYVAKFVSLLRHYRVNAKMTQDELASQLGISCRTYQRIESGETMPGLDFIANSSKILNFKVSEIFDENIIATDEQNVLLRSMRMLEQASEIARIGAWEFDAETQSVYWSSVTREILGVKMDRFPKMDEAIDTFVVGASRDKARAAIADCLRTGKSYELEVGIVDAQGKSGTLVIKGVARTQDEKVVGICGTVQDVTLMREQESALKKAHADLVEIQKFASIGRWDLDIQANSLRWSDSLYDIFEIDNKNFKETYEAFLDLVHPDDREKVNQAYVSSLVSKTPYEITHRLRLPNGRTKWIFEKCNTEFDLTGKPVRSYGYALDITRFM